MLDGLRRRIFGKPQGISVAQQPLELTRLADEPMYGFAPVQTKAMTSTEPYYRTSLLTVEGAGILGAKSRPFDYNLGCMFYRSWVYAAATMNAEGVAKTPLRLYQRSKKFGRKSLFEGRKVDRRTKQYLRGEMSVRPHPDILAKTATWGDDFEEVVEGHPLLQLLKTPNEYESGFDMSVLRVLYQELTGNAYLQVVVEDGRENGMRVGLPRQLLTMPSQWTQIAPDPERKTLILGYVYGKTTTEAYRFAPDEVIHFKRPNPSQLYYGLGKVEAGFSAISISNSNAASDLAFADNMARPDFLVIAKAGATQEQIDRVTAQLNQRLRGTRRSGNFAVMDGDVEVKPLNVAPKEYGTPLKIVEEIAAIFGVPVTKLLPSHPNRSNAETADSSWLRDTIQPLCIRDEETLNMRYLPLWGESVAEDMFLAYQNCVPEDDKARLEEDKVLVSIGARTLNEVRVSRGDEPIPDGDEPLVPANMASLKNVLAEKQLPAPAAPDPKQQIEKAVRDATGIMTKEIGNAIETWQKSQGDFREYIRVETIRKAAGSGGRDSAEQRAEASPEEMMLETHDRMMAHPDYAAIHGQLLAAINDSSFNDDDFDALQEKCAGIEMEHEPENATWKLKAIGENSTSATAIDPAPDEAERQRREREKVLILLLLAFFADLEWELRSTGTLADDSEEKLSDILFPAMQREARYSIREMDDDFDLTPEQTIAAAKKADVDIKEIADDSAKEAIDVTKRRWQNQDGGVEPRWFGQDRATAIAGDNLWEAGQRGDARAAQQKELKGIWVTEGDTKVCFQCLSFEGMEVDADHGPFPISDSHDGCRCDVDWNLPDTTGSA